MAKSAANGPWNWPIWSCMTMRRNCMDGRNLQSNSWWWLAWTTLLCTESKSFLIRVNQCNQCKSWASGWPVETTEARRQSGSSILPEFRTRQNLNQIETSIKSRPGSLQQANSTIWQSTGVPPSPSCGACGKIFTHPIRLKIRHFGIVDFNVFSATYPLTWTKDTAKLTLFIRPSLNGQV